MALAKEWRKRSADNYGQGQWAEAHDRCAAELEAALQREPSEKEIEAAWKSGKCGGHSLGFFDAGVRWALAWMRGQS